MGERHKIVVLTLVGTSVLFLFGWYIFSKRKQKGCKVVQTSNAANKKDGEREDSQSNNALPEREAFEVPRKHTESSTTVPQSKPMVVDTNQLSMKEAETLVSLLSSSTEDKLLEDVLVTIGNAAAFTSNQNALREAGALPKLNSLLRAHNMALKVGQSVTYPAVINGVLSSINNMAMNEHNQTQLKDCIPTLIDFASTDKADESLQLASLQALTNLSIKPEYHEPYTKLIQQLYDHLDNGPTNIKMQALKVLANLSTNEGMVPHLLAAKAPRCLFELLAPGATTDLLIRWITILANVMCIVRDTGLTAQSLPPEYKAPSPEMTYTGLYGHNSINKFKSKVFVLSRHTDADVRHQASRIYGCFT